MSLYIAFGSYRCYLNDVGTKTTNRPLGTGITFKFLTVRRSPIYSNIITAGMPSAFLHYHMVRFSEPPGAPIVAMRYP